MLGWAKKYWAIPAFLCLVLGFGFALWQASHHHQEQNPPREQNAQNHKTNADHRGKGAAGVQINCDPNCAADDSDQDRNPITEFFYKSLKDPLTIVTLLLVIVVMIQVSDGRHSAERQLRAYVSVKTVNFHRPDSRDGDIQEWPIQAVFRNDGQTPAYATVITAETVLEDYPRPKKSVFVIDKKKAADDIIPPAIISPHGVVTVRLGGLEPGREMFLAAQKAGKYAYVWGRVDYVDTFGRKHFTDFQMWHGFGPIHQFGFCEVGNLTDDEFPDVWWRKLLAISRRWCSQI